MDELDRLFADLLNNLSRTDIFSRRRVRRDVDAWPQSWQRAERISRANGYADGLWIPGDVVYPDSTPSRQDPRRASQNVRPPLSDEMIRLKVASIRNAVDSYVAIDTYEAFTPYFLRRVEGYPGAIRECIARSFGNILEQFNLARPGRVASTDMVLKYLRARPRVPELARVSLMLSKARWDAVDFTEVTLAMVLYQASVISYLSDLRRAIAAMYPFPTNEQRTARRIVDTALKSFHDFTIFAFLLPLAILMRQEMSAETCNGGTEETLREEAISAAWRELFEANLLQTDFSTTSMICPASNHLRHVKDRRIVEMFYRFVVENREQGGVRTLLREVGHVIRASLLPPREYYYQYFLRGGGKEAAVKALLYHKHMPYWSGL